MALDFYELSDLKHKSRLFSLGEKEYVDLEPVFKEFQKRTSVYIDPFGNTRIYGAHVNIIVEIVKKYSLNLEAKKDRLLLQTVVKFKDSLLDTNHGLLIIGD